MCSNATVGLVACCGQQQALRRAQFKFAGCAASVELIARRYHDLRPVIDMQYVTSALTPFEPSRDRELPAGSCLITTLRKPHVSLPEQRLQAAVLRNIASMSRVNMYPKVSQIMCASARPCGRHRKVRGSQRCC